MTRRTLVPGLVACVLVTGCAAINWSFLDPKKPDIDPGLVRGIKDPLTESLAYRDAVSQYAWVEGLRKMRVRGYGLVAGLGDHGAAQCPATLRQRLIQAMYKRPEFQTTRSGAPTPEELIDSSDTAVVLVQGEIAAAAPATSRFDVYVQAVPGTQTTSLKGGRLWPCDLYLYRDVDETTSVMGKVLAEAEGPISWNPFSTESDSATRDDVRRGVVHGGGITKEDRRIRLVLSEPSYRQATSIADRINARFSGDKIAAAESPSYIKLKVPRDYQGNPEHFLRLVLRLYVPDRPGFLDRRCQDLADEMLRETAPHEEIALAWEGIGKTALPTVRKLYADPRKYVSFYSALAGLRLGDDLAVEVIGLHVADEDSPYRLTAIDALGQAPPRLRASGPLRQLLDDPDPRIRVAAYEALLQRGDAIIQSEMIGRDNFVLDRVPGGRENLIYAKRDQTRRLVLFGDDLRCKPPLFYRDDLLTLSATEQDEKLTVVRKTPVASVVSPPIPTPYDVESVASLLGGRAERDADGTVTGLGLAYSSVVQVLSELCRLNSVNAKFMFEQPSTIEMFGPLTPAGREESEL